MPSSSVEFTTLENVFVCEQLFLEPQHASMISTNSQVCIPLEGDSHQIFQDTPEESKKHIEMVARFITERIS